MKIGIVNDMALARESIRRLVVSVPGYEVIWQAENGETGIDRVREQRPDLVLMDLFMPIVSGVEATRRIMAETPCPILIVTTSVSEHLTQVYDAMSQGALDAADTPALGRSGEIVGGHDLLKKIATISKLVGYTRTSETATIPRRRADESNMLDPLIAIGASTGGPNAIAEILRSLPSNLESPIVLVQHIDRSLAPGLASWLSKESGHRVETVQEGRRIEPGDRLLSATNDHMILGPNRRLFYSHEPSELNYRPSVDHFFESLAEHWSESDIAVLLTGMGADGAKGLLKLKKSGWMTIAQDEATSIVFGMPKEAARLNAADKILPLGRIGPTLLELTAQIKRGRIE